MFFMNNSKPPKTALVSYLKLCDESCLTTAVVAAVVVVIPQKTLRSALPSLLPLRGDPPAPVRLSRLLDSSPPPSSTSDPPSERSSRLLRRRSFRPSTHTRRRLPPANVTISTPHDQRPSLGPFRSSAADAAMRPLPRARVAILPVARLATGTSKSSIERARGIVHRSRFRGAAPNPVRGQLPP